MLNNNNPPPLIPAKAGIQTSRGWRMECDQVLLVRISAKLTEGVLLALIVSAQKEPAHAVNPENLFAKTA